MATKRNSVFRMSSTNSVRRPLFSNAVPLLTNRSRPTALLPSPTTQPPLTRIFKLLTAQMRRRLWRRYASRWNGFACGYLTREVIRWNSLRSRKGCLWTWIQPLWSVYYVEAYPMHSDMYLRQSAIIDLVRHKEALDDRKLLVSEFLVICTVDVQQSIVCSLNMRYRLFRSWRTVRLLVRSRIKLFNFVSAILIFLFISNGTIYSDPVPTVYNDLSHPPATSISNKYAWRTADGSYNNIDIPDLGKVLLNFHPIAKLSSFIIFAGWYTVLAVCPTKSPVTSKSTSWCRINLRHVGVSSGPDTH